MLILTSSMKDIDFSQLMLVYEESNQENGKQLYPQLCPAERQLMAEQDFYSYLSTVFQNNQAQLAVWAPQGRYKAALRLESYWDGVLLTALETAPEERKKGYAEALLRNTIQAVHATVIYSHVAKKNIPSIRLHKKCGFSCIKDHAVYLDGTVTTDASTYALYVK